MEQGSNAHGLRGLRQSRGMTQESLAALAQVPQEAISRVERGSVPRGVVVAVRIARALGVTVETLFGEAATRNP